MQQIGPLTGRTAIVTGSGRGIGRAVAEKLAAEGAAVVVNDLEADIAHETANSLSEAGAMSLGFGGDVTADGFGESIVAAAMSRFGSLDIVVNNAGYTWDGFVQNMTQEQWAAMQAVHVTAPFRLLQAARPHLTREIDRGETALRRVVNVSSVAGLIGVAGQANYASAKAGMLGLTRALAAEWGPRGVTVNAVALGLIDTRLSQPKQNIRDERVRIGLTPDVRSRFVSQIPLGRAGTAEEAANSVYLLCSPEASYITGHTLVCSGGLG